MKKIGFILFVVVLVVIGCKKPITKPNNGIYRGTFTKINSVAGDTIVTLCNLAIFEEYSNYSMTVDTAYGLPYACNGGFTILDDSRIEFINRAQGSNNFYQYYYLDTIYNYTFDNTKFVFSKTRGPVTYEYSLVRN